MPIRREKGVVGATIRAMRRAVTAKDNRPKRVRRVHVRSQINVVSRSHLADGSEGANCGMATAGRAVENAIYAPVSAPPLIQPTARAQGR